ncbi:hypothetical protein Goshw_027013 [Gossypium schwendimanii]|uniref:Uncharacterized protein n=1 Tax=Gossypium schwendimanii TaxID=34291 RepID=A0A7J9LYI5_GOSSC|nr:hypothetical protein [Gossypium schwendimanii]
MAQQLGNFIGSSIQYDTKAIVDEVRDYMRIRVKLDARVLLRRKKKIMLNTNKHVYAQAIEGKKKLVMKSSVFLMAASRRAKGVNESDNFMYNVRNNLGINLVGNLVNKESGQMSSMEDFKHDNTCMAHEESPLGPTDLKKQPRMGSLFVSTTSNMGLEESTLKHGLVPNTRLSAIVVERVY